MKKKQLKILADLIENYINAKVSAKEEFSLNALYDITMDYKLFSKEKVCSIKKVTVTVLKPSMFQPSDILIEMEYTDSSQGYYNRYVRIEENDTVADVFLRLIL